MAHSNLPQQIDVRAEHGVQIEVDHLRGVAYMHVDGYTCARVNYGNVPINLELKHDVGQMMQTAQGPILTKSRGPLEIDIEAMVDVSKAAKAVSGMIMAERFLSGKDPVLLLTGPEVDKIEKDVLRCLKNL